MAQISENMRILCSTGIIEKSELFKDTKIRAVNAELTYNVFGHPICSCRNGLPHYKKLLKHSLLPNIYVQVHLCKSCHEALTIWNPPML